MMLRLVGEQRAPPEHEHHVGRAGLGQVAGHVEHQRVGLRVPVPGLEVRQQVIHLVGDLRPGLEALRRGPPHRRDHEPRPLPVEPGEGAEGDREAVDGHRGSPLPRRGGHPRPDTARDVEPDGVLVELAEQREVPLQDLPRDALHAVGRLLDLDPGVAQRAEEPIDVPTEAERLVPVGPSDVVDALAALEPAVEDRHPGLALEHPVAVEVHDPLGHRRATASTTGVAVVAIGRPPDDHVHGLEPLPAHHLLLGAAVAPLGLQHGLRNTTKHALPLFQAEDRHVCLGAFAERAQPAAMPEHAGGVVRHRPDRLRQPQPHRHQLGQDGGQRHVGTHGRDAIDVGAHRVRRKALVQAPPDHVQRAHPEAVAHVEHHPPGPRLPRLGPHLARPGEQAVGMRPEGVGQDVARAEEGEHVGDPRWRVVDVCHHRQPEDLGRLLGEPQRGRRELAAAVAPEADLDPPDHVPVLARQPHGLPHVEQPDVTGLREVDPGQGADDPGEGDVQEGQHATRGTLDDVGPEAGEGAGARAAGIDEGGGAGGRRDPDRVDPRRVAQPVNVRVQVDQPGRDEQATNVQHPTRSRRGQPLAHRGHPAARDRDVERPVDSPGRDRRGDRRRGRGPTPGLFPRS